MPTAIYTMIGGVQAVTWTDVKQMFLIVFGLVAVAGGADRRAAADVSVADALHVAGATGRLQTFDFRFDLTKRYTFWSGTIGALFLFLSVLRHRPEPGAALPHGAIGGRGARVAVHERLLEDSAAGAGAAHRRAACSCSTCSRRRRCCSTPCTTQQVAGERARRPNTRRSSSASHDAVDARKQAADAVGRGATRPAMPAAMRVRRSAAFTSWNERGAGDPQRGASRWCRTCTGDRVYNDVNYVFPTLVTTQLPIGLVGLMHRGDLRRGHVGHRRPSSHRSRPRR